MDHSKHPLSDEQSHEVGIAGADADGWIPNTGTQPVADDVLIDYRMRDGDVDEGVRADSVYWYYKCLDWDIAHWRRHKPAQPDPRDEQIRQLREALEREDAALRAWEECGAGTPEWDAWQAARKDLYASVAALQATEPKA